MYCTLFVVRVAVLRVCDHGATKLACPLLPLMRSRDCWASVDPVKSLKIRKHDVKLGQPLLDLIYGCLWESTPRSVKDSSLVFHVVQHEDIAFAHHLEVYPFPSDFVLISVLGTFLRDYKEPVRSRGVVEFLKCYCGF